jgi:hypothetical protein
METDIFYLPDEYEIYCKSYQYKKIKEFYGNKTSKRSKVPLINHINEGIVILDRYFKYIKYEGDYSDVIKAFIMHPLIQNDENLGTNFHNFQKDNKLSYTTSIFAFEYRNIANAYLSKRIINSLNEIKLSPIKEVNYMLVADKVQNYKDFMLYHYNKIENSSLLLDYFGTWFSKLNISNELYNHLIK